MNIAPNWNKPHRKVIQIEERDKREISPRSLIAFAFEHDAVDGKREEDMLIWVQIGKQTPTSYLVVYLRKCALLGAMFSSEKGLFLPEEEDVCFEQ